jgi:hypothetical protein
VCLARVLHGLVSSDDLAGLREQLLAQLEVDEANQEALDLGAGYYISKSWLNGFKRRGSSGGSGTASRPIDPPPTAGIYVCGLVADCRQRGFRLGCAACRTRCAA